MSRFVVPAVFVAVGLLAAAPVPKAKKADPFPYATGTKWDYTHDGDAKNVWVEEVVECDDKDGVVTFKVEITPNRGAKRWEKYRLKAGELHLIATQNGDYDPPMLIGKVGMKAGDEWETSYGYSLGGATATVDTKLTVGKAEEITTPFGKLTATPVVRTIKGQRGNADTTFWFADGVGMVRQTSPGVAEPLQDLKAFTPGKK